MALAILKDAILSASVSGVPEATENGCLMAENSIIRAVYSGNKKIYSAL